jgi:hypothetical protein
MISMVRVYMLVLVTVAVTWVVLVVVSARELTLPVLRYGTGMTEAVTTRVTIDAVGAWDGESVLKPSEMLDSVSGCIGN